jgi:hypothetical protein
MTIFRQWFKIIKGDGVDGEEVEIIAHFNAVDVTIGLPTVTKGESRERRVDLSSILQNNLRGNEKTGIDWRLVVQTFLPENTESFKQTSCARSLSLHAYLQIILRFVTASDQRGTAIQFLLEIVFPVALVTCEMRYGIGLGTNFKLSLLLSFITEGGAKAASSGCTSWGAFFLSRFQ